jgi:hypothetical protein
MGGRCSQVVASSPEVVPGLIRNVDGHRSAGVPCPSTHIGGSMAKLYPERDTHEVTELNSGH